MDVQLLLSFCLGDSWAVIMAVCVVCVLSLSGRRNLRPSHKNQRKLA